MFSDRVRTAEDQILDPDIRQELIAPREWVKHLYNYLRWLAASGRSGETRKLRIYHLRRFALHVGRPPFEVEQQDVVDFLSEPDWSNETRRSYRASLRSFYAWAVDHSLIDHSPAAKLPAVTHRNKKPRPAPVDVIIDAIRTAKDDTRLMIELAAFAGLRTREIASVHTDHVARDRAGYVLHVQGKGDRERTVPLQTGIAEAIIARPSGFVFPGAIDGHLAPKTVTDRVSKQLRGDWTAHTLRHYFASEVYTASGNNLRIVQELLGHASVATTQIYTAVSEDRLRAAVNAAQVHSYRHFGEDEDE